MKCLRRAKISINQVSQEPNLKEQSLPPDLEILNQERLYFTTKMQKQFPNTKNILSKIQIYKKTSFTQCQNNEITYERSKLGTQ